MPQNERSSRRSRARSGRPVRTRNRLVRSPSWLMVGDSGRSTPCGGQWWRSSGRWTEVARPGQRQLPAVEPLEPMGVEGDDLAADQVGSPRSGQNVVSTDSSLSVPQPRRGSSSKPPTAGPSSAAPAAGQEVNSGSTPNSCKIASGRAERYDLGAGRCPSAEDHQNGSTSAPTWIPITPPRRSRRHW